MSADIIRDIRETEQIAEEKIREAQQTAKDIIKKAEKDAQKLLEEAISAEVEKGKAIVDASEKEAAAIAQENMLKNRQICEEISNKAMLRFDEAVKLVMERIVKFNGHS